MPDEQNASGRGLKLHHLRPAPGAHKAKTRVGRGEASKGKTAGRGTKGTKARSKMRLGFEGGQMPLQRRIPKLKLLQRGIRHQLPGGEHRPAGRVVPRGR